MKQMILNDIRYCGGNADQKQGHSPRLFERFLEQFKLEYVMVLSFCIYK